MPNFTLEELHRRILYFELKMLLKDALRLGQTLPDRWLNDLYNLRDEEPVWRLLADWIGGTGGKYAQELSELILLQIELMDEIPADYLSTGSMTYQSKPELSAWHIDALELPSPKTHRRAEILETLYSHFSGRMSLMAEMRVSRRDMLAVGGTGATRERYLNDLIARRMLASGLNPEAPFHTFPDNHNNQQVYLQEVKARLGKSNRVISDTIRFAKLHSGHRFQDESYDHRAEPIALIYSGKNHSEISGIRGGFLYHQITRGKTQEDSDYFAYTGSTLYGHPIDFVELEGTLLSTLTGPAFFDHSAQTKLLTKGKAITEPTPPSPPPEEPLSTTDHPEPPPQPEIDWGMMDRAAQRQHILDIIQKHEKRRADERKAITEALKNARDSPTPWSHRH